MEWYVKVYNIRKLIEIFNLNDWDLSAISIYRNDCITRYERDINQYWYKYFNYQKLLMWIRESYLPDGIDSKTFKLIMTIK